jgi:hypothetical protein
MKTIDLSKNPTAKYQRSNTSLMLNAAAHLLDNEPWFTWWDIPRMTRDPQVRFGLRMLRSPFQQVEWKVQADSHRVARFVDRTLRSFWQKSLPRLLQNYFKYGRSPGGYEFYYDSKDRLWKLARVRAVEPSDATARVFREGPQSGQLAGFDLPTIDGMRTVPRTHAFWFAGNEELCAHHDWPRLAGAFTPWLEKNGKGGARHSRRLWYWRHAFSGGTIRHPNDYITLADGTKIHSEDVARQLGENFLNGSVAIVPNTPHPSDKMAGKFAWEMEAAESRNDTAGMRDYPKDLDEEIMLGIEIPTEVWKSGGTGSGFSGRAIPMETWLGGADDVATQIYSEFQNALNLLVGVNFGGHNRYDVELLSLVKQFREAGMQGQGGGQTGQPQQPQQQPRKDGSVPYRGPRGGNYLLNPKTGNKRPMNLSDAGSRDSVDGNQFRDSSRQIADSLAGTSPQERRLRRAAMLAMLQIQEEAMRSGKSADAPEVQAQLEALAELADDPEQLREAMKGEPVNLAWQEYGASRSGKKRWKDDQSGKLRYQNTRPGEHAEKRQKAQANAKRGSEIVSLALRGEASADHLRELADHLPAMTVDQLRSARVRLGATFSNARKRDAMVSALVEHVRGRAEERADAADLPQDVQATIKSAKGEADKKKASQSRLQKRQAKQGGESFADYVRSIGGIDPGEIKTIYRNLGHAIEDGIPLNIFRNGGQGLDTVAEQMVRSGMLQDDPKRHATEQLIEKIRNKALVEYNSVDFESKLEEHYKLIQEAHDAGITPRDIAENQAIGERTARDETEAAFREDYPNAGGTGVAETQGEDDRIEASERGDDGLSDADTSFEFGANEAPNGTSETARQETPEEREAREDAEFRNRGVTETADLFGGTVRTTAKPKGGKQPTIEDAHREAWTEKAREHAEEHGLGKIEQWDAGGRFRVGEQWYQVGKAEDGYPIANANDTAFHQEAMDKAEKEYADAYRVYNKLQSEKLKYQSIPLPVKEITDSNGQKYWQPFDPETGKEFQTYKQKSEAMAAASRFGSNASDDGTISKAYEAMQAANKQRRELFAASQEMKPQRGNEQDVRDPHAKAMDAKKVDELKSLWEDSAKHPIEKIIEASDSIPALSKADQKSLAEHISVGSRMSRVPASEYAERLKLEFQGRARVHWRASNEMDEMDAKRAATIDGYTKQLGGLSGDAMKAKAKALIIASPEHEEHIREAYGGMKKSADAVDRSATADTVSVEGQQSAAPNAEGGKMFEPYKDGTDYHISGDTKTHKDSLKSMGARWDGVRKEWVFRGKGAADKANRAVSELPGLSAKSREDIQRDSLHAELSKLAEFHAKRTELLSKTQKIQSALSAVPRVAFSAPDLPGMELLAQWLVEGGDDFDGETHEPAPFLKLAIEKAAGSQ